MQDKTQLPTLTVTTSEEQFPSIPSTTPDTLSPVANGENKPGVLARIRSLSQRRSISESSGQPNTPTSATDAQDTPEKPASPVEPSGETPPTDAASTPGHQNDAPVSTQPKETLRSAFDYTFSKAANIETAQQMFRDACADHVYRVNSYKREEFIQLLEEKLSWRPRFASPEFLQTFIRITAFVHQYVDPQLDEVIVKLFVTLKKDPKGVFASRVYPKENMLPVPFSNGLQALYIAHRDQRSTEGLPQPGWYVPVTDMEQLTAFNRELFKTADHKHVDAEKLLYTLEVSDLWKEFEQKKASRFNFCSTT